MPTKFPLLSKQAARKIRRSVHDEARDRARAIALADAHLVADPLPHPTLDAFATREAQLGRAGSVRLSELGSVRQLGG